MPDATPTDQSSLAPQARTALKNAPGVPGEVDEKLKRGEGRMRALAPERNECWEFFRGNTYAYRTAEGALTAQSTAVSTKGRGGKPPHRIRSKRPILTPFVRQDVSHATQRVPNYTVTPTSTDPDSQAAAKTSEKIAIYGHEKWNIDQVMDDLVTGALVADESFAWPYWDSTLGPVVADDEDGNTLNEGDVRIRTFTSTEVGWEPGTRFEDSPWYFTQVAVPVDKVLATPGCLVDDLAADATSSSDIGKGKPTSGTKLVIVREYLERPTQKRIRGRRLVIANGKVIMREMDYPLVDSRGDVVDEPALIKLTVLTDPDSDHDHGLVKFVLDIIRSYQEANNKVLQYSQHMLPQVFAPPNTIRSKLTDEPHAVFDVDRPDMVKFRESPGIPRELFEIMDRARGDLAAIFSQNQVPTQVEAARAIQSLLDADETVKARFHKNVARVYSEIMHRCLNLVQRHYTEERDLMIVGDFGPDYLSGFRGGDLLHQTRVIVSPETLQSRTRDQIKQDVIVWAQQGWITPEEAISAIQSGTMGDLGAGFEYDRARAFLIIQKIKEGPEALYTMPPEFRIEQTPQLDALGQPVIDPMTGAPVMSAMPVEVPGWMPRDVDNVRIHKAVFAKWMKSTEWLRLDAGMRTAASEYWLALDRAEAEQNAKAAQEKAAMAEGLGLGNAAAPQFKAMPSLPNPAAPPEAG